MGMKQKTYYKKNQKRPKNTKNAFFANYWANVGEPHGTQPKKVQNTK
jgi:hypothetical protein